MLASQLTPTKASVRALAEAFVQRMGKIKLEPEKPFLIGKARHSLPIRPRDYFICYHKISQITKGTKPPSLAFCSLQGKLKGPLNRSLRKRAEDNKAACCRRWLTRILGLR